MRFTFLVLMSATFLMSSLGIASDVGVFQRDLYDRITIENIGDADIVEGDKTLKIPFKGNIDGAEKTSLMTQSRVIDGLAVDDNALVISLKDAVTDTRHFRIGDRVILDLFFDSKKLSQLVEAKQEKQIEDAVSSAVQVKQVTEETETVAETISESNAIKEPGKVDSHQTVEDIATTKIITPQEETPVEGKEEDVTPSDTKIMMVVEDESVPELKSALTSGALSKATVLSISSIQPFGLAVFERFNRLFIVSDQPDMSIPPQITGNGADLGWKVTEVPVEGGKAWMVPIPQGAYIRPEGRGLIWRVIISDIKPDLKSSDIRRRLADPKNPMVDILMANTATLMRLTDPDYGDNLAVVTSKAATSRMLKPYDFVDFDILPAVVGAVIEPESDGVRVTLSSQYITISNANSLIVSSEPQDKIVASYMNGENLQENPSVQKATLDRVYYFSDWGGKIEPQDYNNKRKELEQFLVMADADSKLGILLDLVKLTLSQNMGVESFGFLDLANDMNDQINKTAEYKALRGAAHFIAGQYDIAETYFNDDELKIIAEVNLWAAATQAAMGDEEEAIKIYDDTASLAGIYPYKIKQAVLAPLALTMINQGQGGDAVTLIDMLDSGDENTQSREDRATIAYLKGRAQAITGRPDEAISNLYKASMADKLGPFGIRSELLLIEDELNREVIKNDEAIQRMERLRFAWRGDDLETEIQIALGKLYIANREPRKGLSILKRAAANTNSVRERREIVRHMADAYKTIFIGDEFKDLDPLIAVATYDEFKELTPVGAEGNALIDALADKLMSMNLMSRATAVLKDKMNRLGEGQHAIKTGLRISAIQLLDREPEEALQTLTQVDQMIAKYRGDDKDDLNYKIVLLKARALAETGKPEQALFMTEGLDDTDDVIRLRIDTAWKTSQWVAVTDNLGKLLRRENITAAVPPTNEQAQLILNQAVALSLSDQYDALQRFAAEYDMAMKQTPFYKTFQIVSRPQNISNLADRQTLLDVTSEVDLFKGSLERIEN